MDIASQIKQARVRAGLSQSQAALAWGVNTRTLQKWEQGSRTPTGRNLLKLLPHITAPAAKGTKSRSS